MLPIPIIAMSAFRSAVALLVRRAVLPDLRMLKRSPWLSEAWPCTSPRHEMNVLAVGCSIFAILLEEKEWELIINL